MKKQFSIYIYLFLSFSILFTSCDKDNDTTEPAPVSPTAGLTLLSEGYATGAGTKVEIWSKVSYLTGYNKIYLFLKDSVSGAAVKSATSVLNPMMDMGTMNHSSPSESPASAQSLNGLYPCAVVFTMSSMSGSWELNITVNNLENSKSGTATFPVSVTDPAVSRIKSFISLTTAETLFVSMLQPEKPVVGLNDLEVVIHRKGAMGMSWPADSSMTVEIDPIMVSMGHGSPNNVDPTHIGMGHYRGTVNYTMSGEWNINFTFLSGASIVNNTLFFETLVP